jgi:hypothetical protein
MGMRYGRDSTLLSLMREGLTVLTSLVIAPGGFMVFSAGPIIFIAAPSPINPGINRVIKQLTFIA